MKPLAPCSPSSRRHSALSLPERQGAGWVNWEPVATVRIPANGQTLIDPTATTEPFLFYQAVSVP